MMRHITPFAAIACTFGCEIVNNIPPAPVPEPKPEIPINQNPVAVSVQICVEISTDNEKAIPREVYLDGKPLPSDCVRVTDLGSVHTLTFGAVAGYITPDSIPIPAGSLEPYDRYTYRAVYTSDVETKCIVTTDQFGNQVPARIVKNGTEEVGLDDKGKPTGRFCGEISSQDEFYLAELLGYVVPNRHLWRGSELARLQEIRYFKMNAFQLCAWGVNPNGDRLDVRPIVDGIVSRTGNCVALTIDEIHRLDWEYIPSMQGPTTYQMDQGVMLEGQLHEVERVFLPNSIASKRIIIETLPNWQGYENFVNQPRRSLGWQLSRDEPVIEIVLRDSRTEIRVGMGGRPSTSILVSDREFDEYRVTLLQSDRLALLCGQCKWPYGGVAETPVTITGTTQPHRYGRLACAAINPMEEQTVLCQPPVGTDLAPTSTLTIPAGTINPGELQIVEPRFVPSGSRPAPSEPRQIRVEFRGPTVQLAGTIHQAELTVPVTMRRDNRTSNGDWSSYEDTLFEGNAVVTLELGAVDNLLVPAQRTLTLDYASLPASAFNQATRRYEFVVQYTANRPATLVCQKVLNHNHLEVAVGIEFDGRQPNARWQGRICSYVSVGESHQVWSWSPAGYGYGFPVIVPANVLPSGGIKALVKRLVLQTRLASFCVETNPVVAEMVVQIDNVPIYTGWSDVGQRGGGTVTQESCFALDVRQSYVIYITGIVNGQSRTILQNIPANQYEAGRRYPLQYFF